MKILKKQILAQDSDTKITKIIIKAPDIAAKVQPGEVVVLMVNEKGERIPLTVVDKDPSSATVTLIIQEVGLTTKLLGKLNVGDSVYALSGPLGHPTEMKKYGKIILVGGGVGIAEIYPVATGFKEHNNHIVTILGARTKDLLILEPELRSVSDKLQTTAPMIEKGLLPMY